MTVIISNDDITHNETLQILILSEIVAHKCDYIVYLN